MSRLSVRHARTKRPTSPLFAAFTALVLTGVAVGCASSSDETNPTAQDDNELRRRCGDGRCSAARGETCSTCSRDCGPCPVDADGGPLADGAPVTPPGSPDGAPPPLEAGGPPAPPPSPPAPDPGLSGNSITAADCTQPKVQAAINAAADGDRVLVPAGTCVWNAAVTMVNKTLTLTGAGGAAGGTKIVYGGSGHVLLTIDAGNKTGRVDISGFWLSGGDPDYWNGTALTFGGPNGWKNFRVHHNVFEGNTQWTIKGSSGVHGLIDHNTFRGTAAGIMLYGDGASDWATPLVLGTADFFFVEDNTFLFDDNYGSTKHPVMDMDHGGRQVFRRNRVVNGLWETHDKARSGLVSANAYEIYENEFSASTNQWKGLDISAGTGVVWGNTFAGDFSVTIGAMDYKSFDPRSVKRCDGTDPADQNVPGEAGWRCQYQIGSMGEGPTAYGYPLYLWSNTKNGSSIGMACTDGCNHVQAGRDYVNSASSKPGYTPHPYPHPLNK